MYLVLPPTHIPLKLHLAQPVKFSSVWIFELFKSKLYHFGCHLFQIEEL